jgi:hypothetical protein
MDEQTRIKVTDLIMDALWEDGVDHKQWYLWEIAKVLNIPTSTFESHELPERGVEP